MKSGLPESPAKRRRRGTKEQAAAYRLANPDKVRAWNEAYRARHPERFRQSQRDYKRRRYHSDPEYRLLMQLRARLSKAVERGSGVSAAIAQCGCSVRELLQRIESQFQPGMTWEDRSAWHIDHVFPLSAIDSANAAHVIAVNNWRNLRPVWASDNFAKSGSVTPAAMELFESILASLNTGAPDDATKV